MNGPKVSVIMPSLNVAPYIRECMESVVNQTLTDIEIICVDAGSTDGTREVLEEYAAKDPRIRLIHSDKKSYGYQMNLGIDAAKGEYIGIVETDDYVSPEMYETLYSMAVAKAFPDVGKAGYFSLFEDGKQRELKEKFIITANTGDVFSACDHYEILGAHPSIWSCIYKRSFLEERAIRFMPAPGAGWVDNPFLFRTLCEAERICWVNEPLYYYREARPGSSTELRDCAIPIDRINNIKDYLEETGRNDPPLERVLYKRAIYYIGMICNNPFLTEQNRIDAKKMLKRFNPAVVSDMTEDAEIKYPEFFGESGKHSSKRVLKWIGRKMKGGIQCYRDHGLKYTVIHTCWKISNILSQKAGISAEAKRILSRRKKNLRVLFIASDNNHTSGAFICMTELNAILRKKYGLETMVVLPRQGSGQKLLYQNKIPSILIPSEDWVLPLSQERNEIVLHKIKRAKESNDAAAKRIQELIVREKIDIVHINTTYSYVGAVAALATNTPFVWHLREFLEEDQGNTLWDRAAGNALINKADKVIAISDSIYKKYSGTIDNHRLTRIFDGVDAEKFYMPDKEILHNDPVVFIMIGGFEYYKGQMEFAEACVLLHDRGYHNFVVRFIGTGNPEVRQKVEKIVSDGGISDRVQFLGYHQDVDHYLKTSDISFSCARAEAFGRTTAEAMLSGNLVIGADTAGTRELLQDGKNGLLYRQGDPEDLCRKIAEALTDREKAREIARAGRNYTYHNFTADHNAESIYALYQSIGGSSSGVSRGNGLNS